MSVRPHRFLPKFSCVFAGEPSERRRDWQSFAMIAQICLAFDMAHAPGARQPLKTLRKLAREEARCSKPRQRRCCRPRSSARCRGRPGTRRRSARAASSKRWSNSRYREQYEDAVSCFLRAQELAGLDIVHRRRRALRRGGRRHELAELSADAHGGLRQRAEPAIYNVGAAAYPRGHILHDFLEARVLPRIVGPIGPRQPAIRRDVEDRAAHDQEAGQVRHASCPSCSPPRSRTIYYKDPIERTWAFSEAINKELNELADAGCPVIQMEEPQIHMVPVRGKAFGKLDIDDLVEDLQQHREGPARQDRSVVPHLLGQSVAAAHLQGRAELSADAGGAQQGRCRRAHVRDLLVRPGRSQGDRRASSRTRRS